MWLTGADGRAFIVSLLKQVQQGMHLALHAGYQYSWLLFNGIQIHSSIV